MDIELYKTLFTFMMGEEGGRFINKKKKVVKEFFFGKKIPPNHDLLGALYIAMLDATWHMGKAVAAEMRIENEKEAKGFINDLSSWCHKECEDAKHTIISGTFETVAYADIGLLLTEETNSRIEEKRQELAQRTKEGWWRYFDVELADKHKDAAGLLKEYLMDGWTDDVTKRRLKNEKDWDWDWDWFEITCGCFRELLKDTKEHGAAILAFQHRLTAEMNAFVKSISDDTQHIRKQYELFLSMPGKIKSTTEDTEQMHYTSQYTRFVGRKDIKEKLLEFITGNREEKFLWYMITGDGGSGKSRLALEVAEGVNSKGYEAGFYMYNANPPHDWLHWQPERPTFIVADYALTKTEQTRDLIEKLQRRGMDAKNPLRVPVRLLLVDRQMTGEWEGNIKKYNYIAASRYDKADDKNCIPLQRLTKENLWNIISQVIEEDTDLTKGEKANLIGEKETILQWLSTIDRLERPLYAIFAAKELAHAKGLTILDWDRDKLLESILYRQYGYWEKIKGFSDKIKLLLAVNTLVRKINRKQKKQIADYLKLDERALHSVYQQITARTKEGPEIYYTGLEPDILGEYFVIDTFNNLVENEGADEVEALISFAWNLNLGAFFTTALMLWQDFYKNKTGNKRYYDFESVFREQVENSDKIDAVYELSGYLFDKAYNSNDKITGYEQVIALKDILESKPGYSASHLLFVGYAYYNRGIVKENSGDREGAIADYDQVVAINPQDADAYNNRGIAKANSGDYEGAIADYSQAIAINPEYADAYNNRGAAKAKLGDYEGAIGDYTHAIAINPEYADAYNNRGVAKANSGDREGAIADYSHAIAVNPKYADAYYNRGIAKANSGDHEGAIADYSQAIAINPEYAAAYNNRGIVKYNSGDNEGAIADYSQAIAINPEYAAAYNNRGVAKANSGDNEGAIADFSHAIAINPKYADAYYNRGRAKANSGDNEGAIGDYSQAIAINPEYADAYNNRGNAKANSGDLEGAIADYSHAITINPEYADAYNDRGGAKANSGDNEGAIADYSQAIAINPEYAAAYYNRGIVKANSGDNEGAIADYSQAIAINPEYAAAYYNRGIVKANSGDNEGAIGDCTGAMQINPQFANAYALRGYCYRELGNKTDACEDLKKAMDLGNEVGKKWYEEFCNG